MRYYLILIALINFSASEAFAMPKKMNQQIAGVTKTKKLESTEPSPSIVAKSAPKCSSLYDNCKKVCDKKFTLTNEASKQASSSKESATKEGSKENELCQSSCVKGLASCGESEPEEEIVIKGLSSSPKSTKKISNPSMLQWEFEKGCHEGCDIGSSSAELKGKEEFKKSCKKVCSLEAQ